MGRALLPSTPAALRLRLPKPSLHRRPPPLMAKPPAGLRTRAVLSELPNELRYPKVGAASTGPIPAADLLAVVETAAKAGAEVVMEAVNKPRNIVYKGTADLVTDTDKLSESVILEVVKKNFKDHLILGEEGGLIGDASSDYLWCIDPLDGTTNFAHCYPSFAVSVGVLFRGKPAAASVFKSSDPPLDPRLKDAPPSPLHPRPSGSPSPSQHPRPSDAPSQLVNSEDPLDRDYTDLFNTDDEVFEERDDLVDWVRGIGREHGFVISITKSENAAPGKKARMTLFCERGGTYRHREPKRICNRSQR